MTAGSYKELVRIVNALEKIAAALTTPAVHKGTPDTVLSKRKYE